MTTLLEHLGRAAYNLVQPTRRNHALEHATVALLLRRSEHPIRMLARATSNGFYLYGDVTLEELERASRDALERMKQGEAHLAVSPFCGTNIAIAGTLAALASLLVLGGKDNRGSRLPSAIAAASLAIVAAQPLGALAQRYLTTSAAVEDLRIEGVKRMAIGPKTFYKVETRWGAAYSAPAYARPQAVATR